MLTGTGTDKDYKQAAFWFFKATEQGNAFAQGKLGYLYMAGIGVEQDKVKAYAWLKLASTNKNEEATRELKQFEITLTPEMKSEGNKLFEELKSKKMPTETE